MSDERKVWLITGASRGLGRELALAVLAAGHTVVGTSRNGSLDFAAGAGALHALPLDLTAPGAAEGAVAAALATCGRIDVLVNNAGYGLLGAVEESTDAEAARVFEVNFFGPLRLIRAALPAMRAAGRGHVVNLSSIAGLAPAAGSGLYAAAKFALEGMSQSLAQELAPLGIKVTLVEPGAFRTDFLTEQSVEVSPNRIADYTATAGKSVAYLASINGKQPGDPARGAAAIIEAVESPEPPLHLLLGSDALRRLRAKHEQMADEVARWEATTVGTDYPAL